MDRQRMVRTPKTKLSPTPTGAFGDDASQAVGRLGFMYTLILVVGHRNILPTREEPLFACSGSNYYSEVSASYYIPGGETTVLYYI